ncbi:MAG TPA: GtrA family protein [Coriobacteriia bacterium]|nr:GtrA family protein [Coriobacteriia bacterium]
MDVTEKPSLVTRLKALAETHQEKLRYLVVGVWNTTFSYALFLLLLKLVGPTVQTLKTSDTGWIYWLGDNYYLVCGWIGWIAAVPQSTLTMKYLVFKSKGNALHEVGKAYFVYLPSQWIGTGLLWFFVQVVGLIPQIGAIATTAVQVIFSYVGHKYFTFRPLKAAAEVAILPDDPDEEAASSPAS